MRYLHDLPVILGVIYCGLLPHAIFWASLILCAHAGLSGKWAYTISSVAALAVLCGILLGAKVVTR